MPEANQGEGRTWLRWVVLAAITVRVVYLAAYLTELPFAYGPVGDSLVYLMQAQDVRAGRLGSPALVAFSPLYGYVLALLTGGGPGLLPILAQLAAGVANIVLVARLSRSLFGERAAIASALLMLGYGTLMFLESKLMTETFALTLTLLATRAYLSAGFKEGGTLACLGCGVLFASAVLMRASMLFCLPLVVLCALVRWGADPSPAVVRARRAALCGAGAAGILAMNGLLNLHHAGVFVPVIMVSKTLETSARTEWKGSFDAYAHDGRQASPLDVVEQAARRLKEGPAREPPLWQRLESLDGVGLVAGLPRKWAGTFQNRESFQEYGFSGERSTLAVLKALPVSFGTIAILALFGAWGLARQMERRVLVPLAPLVLGTLVTTGLYYPSSRYRLVMLVPLLLLAGAGVARAWPPVRGRAGVATASLLGLAVAATTWNWMAQGPGNVPAWHLELAVSSFQAGDYEACAREALAAQRGARPGSPVRTRADQLMALASARKRQQR